MPPRSTRKVAQLWVDLRYVAAGLALAVGGLMVTVPVVWTNTARADAHAEVSTAPAAARWYADPAPAAGDLTPPEAKTPDADGPLVNQPADEGGALSRYPTRTGSGEGRNPLLVEMQKGRTYQQEKELRRQNVSRSRSVSEGSRTELARSRHRVQQSHHLAITVELDRLIEELRRKEEEERRLAEERALGTLRDGEFEGTYQPPVGGSARAAEMVGEVSGSGGARPVTGGYSIAARWGAIGSWSRYHTGIDLSAPIGRPVVAAADGVVIAPVGGGWAGIHVIIEHPNGDATLYAHLGSRNVVPGQAVRAGEMIGTIGMTGRTFGPHLHFEYYPRSGDARNPYATTDPYTWMLARGVRL